MHSLTIKAPFESSTFINLEQSIDLKAESSKLPERIIKQPVSSWVHFSAICTRYFTVSGGQAHLPPVTPCPLFWAASLSLGFHAFRAHKGEAVTGESPWGHGSLPPSGSRRERERTNSKPAKQQPWSSAAGRSPSPRPPRRSWVESLLRREAPSGCPGLRREGCGGLGGWAQGFKKQISNLPPVHPPTHSAPQAGPRGSLSAGSGLHFPSPRYPPS